MLRGQYREVKKIIHKAYLTYPNNPAVQAVWAQSMLADDSPEEIIKDLDQVVKYHLGLTDLDLLVIHLIGQAYLRKGDFRTGIAHLESATHVGVDRNAPLIDRFKIILAQAYEDREYYLSVLKTLGTVEDRTAIYEEDKSVEYKCSELVEKINTMRKQGIIKNMEFTYEYEGKEKRSMPGFLEFGKK